MRQHSARHTVEVVVTVAVAVVVPVAAGVICRQLQAEQICEAAYSYSAVRVFVGFGFAPLLLLLPASIVEIVFAPGSVMELVAEMELARIDP